MKKNLYFLFAVILSIESTQIIAQSFTTVNTYAGTSAAGLVNGPLASAQFNAPYAICFDGSTGNFFVADVYNHCIRKISGGIVSTFAGNGSQGDVDAQGTNARFYVPTGVAFYNGEVYVTDAGNNKVKKIDAAGNVTTIAGTGVVGYQDGAAATSKFYNPTGIKVASNGDVYVADYLNHCIRKISGGQVTTIAGVGTVSGDQLGSTATALFDRPSDVAIDASGKIYVADQLNHKVKVITGGMVSLLAGSGVASSVDGTGAAASFNQPAYLNFDMFGNLYLCEFVGNKVRRITAGGVTTTVAGSGVQGYVNGATATAEFHSPYGVCADNNGNIYVGDRGNNVIRNLSKSDVGMTEVNSTTTLTIFPNPSTDQFIINTEGLNFQTISIYDFQGKLCKTIPVLGEPSQVTISIAELAAGEYLIIAEGEKRRSTGKLIKQ